VLLRVEMISYAMRIQRSSISRSWSQVWYDIFAGFVKELNVLTVCGTSSLTRIYLFQFR